MRGVIDIKNGAWSLIDDYISGCQHYTSIDGSYIDGRSILGPWFDFGDPVEISLDGQWVTRYFASYVPNANGVEMAYCMDESMDSREMAKGSRFRVPVPVPVLLADADVSLLLKTLKEKLHGSCNK